MKKLQFGRLRVLNISRILAVGVCCSVNYSSLSFDCCSTRNIRLKCHIRLLSFRSVERCIYCEEKEPRHLLRWYSEGGSVAEWLACWTQAQKAPVQIAAATLSGNSLRQTVHTHRASVHLAAKLVAALLRVARVTAGLAESSGTYRRVYDSRHLQADCQEPRSAPEPYALILMSLNYIFSC